MKIAVIGSGNIGGTLGAKWAAAGHAVSFGVRDPHSPKTKAALAAARNAHVTGIGDAIAAADVVVLALPSAAVAETLAAHGAALGHKLVIDTTNKFGAPVVNSIAEIRAAAPHALICRAFNSLGWEVFANPQVGGVQADLFYCGPDGEARATIEQLIAEVGLRPVRAGSLDQASVVDAMGALWVSMVFGQKMSRHSAFKLLTD